jgi:hypothetical protein
LEIFANYTAARDITSANVIERSAVPKSSGSQDNSWKRDATPEYDGHSTSLNQRGGGQPHTGGGFKHELVTGGYDGQDEGPIEKRIIRAQEGEESGPSEFKRTTGNVSGSAGFKREPVTSGQVEAPIEKRIVRAQEKADHR